jgi:hypothetical protein
MGLAIIILVIGAAPIGSSPCLRRAASGVAPVAVAADRPPEVRLRRLHLVRPDLIPYPIIYEIFC